MTRAVGRRPRVSHAAARSRQLEKTITPRRLRPIAAVIVALGAVLLAADVGPNPVILKFPVPGERGIHVADLGGTALLVLGVVMLWRAPPRSPRTQAPPS